ncbi:MAG: OsmC family protein [Bacteroidia bacterium]|nr:OsmC family protein [Bacteroidia bacterium]
MKHIANAVWKGTVKEGNGQITTRSKVLENTQYSFKSRFENGAGTNPDELLAASHAGCFAMATSLLLGKEGYTPESLEAKCELTMNPDKLEITASHLTLHARIPNISNAKFLEIANHAKEACPISKVLNCTITLDASLASAQ